MVGANTLRSRRGIILKILYLILLAIFVLFGCNLELSLSFSEVSKENIKQGIQSFLQDVKEKNGVHLYFDNQNDTLFVYLNGLNVIQGKKAVNFTHFDVEKENNTLNLLYKSVETSNYTTSSLNSELLYKVNLDKYYENIKLFHNGKETSLGTIYGQIQYWSNLGFT